MLWKVCMLKRQVVDTPIDPDLKLVPDWERF